MTRRYVYDRHPELVTWAEARIPFGSFRDDARAIGLEIDGTIAAAVIYDTFSTTNCFVHIAAAKRKWFSPEFATVAMAYPFIQCGYPRISCIVSEQNRLSLRLTRHFGWTEEGRLRHAGPEGEDVILFGMLREECRFLPVTLGTGKISAVAV